MFISGIRPLRARRERGKPSQSSRHAGVRHARKIIFQMAEVAVSQGLMRKILNRIASPVPVPSG